MTMPAIKVEFTVDVKASAARIWDVLADVKSWTQWVETTYAKCTTHGSLIEGSSFSAELGGIKWNVTVIEARKPEKIIWTGRRFGIKAIHEWEFTVQGENTRVLTRECMSGWIILPLYPLIKARLSKYDKKWLADLKYIAENP
jgi:hypothetical protein